MLLRMKFLALLIILLLPLVAKSAEVPKYFHYEGLLYNDVGEPLPDGKHNIYFRIIDSAEKVVYEEVQEVDVVGGAVSVMVGAGAGGIARDTLLPDGPKYLEVQVDGLPPEPLMEMVSVPYATYADVALNVKEGSVGSAEIKEGSITVDHLAENFVNELTEQITTGGDSNTIMVKEEFTNYQTTMQGSEGAKSIGVNSDFRYSSSGNIQEVLEDLDSAIRKREEDVKVAETNIRADMSSADQSIKTEMSAADQSIRTDMSGLINQTVNQHISNSADAHGINNYMKTADYIQQVDGYPRIKGEYMPTNIATTDALDQARTDFNAALDEVAALPKIIAWGKVNGINCPNNICTLLAGYGVNPNIVHIATGGYEVHFSQALDSENYAVTVTAYDQSRIRTGVMYETSQQFTVVLAGTGDIGSDQNFYFIVVQ